jgi:hypothetical protein
MTAALLDDLGEGTTEPPFVLGPTTSTMRTYSRRRIGNIANCVRSHSSRAVANHPGLSSSARMSSPRAETTWCQPSGIDMNIIDESQLRRMSTTPRPTDVGTGIAGWPAAVGGLLLVPTGTVGRPGKLVAYRVAG